MLAKGPLRALSVAAIMGMLAKMGVRMTLYSQPALTLSTMALLTIRRAKGKVGGIHATLPALHSWDAVFQIHVHRMDAPPATYAQLIYPQPY